MKEIEIKKTKLTDGDLKGYILRPDVPVEDTKDYKQIIEHALDIPPQGGFTPKDIRDRNRIQKSLDDIKDNKLKLEDSDYKNLSEIIKTSRWGSRKKELQDFLDVFEKDK